MMLPGNALYGIQTARAVENFPITDVRLRDFPELVVALAMVKMACALANMDSVMLSTRALDASVAASDSILTGQHHEHFVRAKLWRSRSSAPARFPHWLMTASRIGSDKRHWWTGRGSRDRSDGGGCSRRACDRVG